jgi:NAD(P)-dependent dehydrogenase (short-subunit alcohol dehydrogenase family)
MSESAPVAVVAGVGPGLGTALCRRFGQAGYRVAALARRAEPLDALAEAAHAEGWTLRPMPCDLTEGPTLRQTLTTLAQDWDAPTIYVHHASQLIRGPFLELDPHAFETIWRITVESAVVGAQAVLPGMAARGQGTLLFTGATAALRGGSGFAAFASAKFALRGLAQSLAREFGPQGIHVAHIILDGLIGPSAQETGGEGVVGSLQPEAIAETYLHLAQQHRSAWTFELDLRPDRERF